MTGNTWSSTSYNLGLAAKLGPLDPTSAIVVIVHEVLLLAVVISIVSRQEVVAVLARLACKRRFLFSRLGV